MSPRSPLTVQVPISTVSTPQSLPIQDSAAALTCGRGPDLDLSFTLSFKSLVVVLFAACICKQSKAERRKVSEVKWPKGLNTRQEAAGVFCVYK